MSKCTQCPNVVGDSYQRDCVFPDCVGGWQAAYEDLVKELAETEQALVDIWKAFASPMTKKEQIAAMNKHDHVLQRMIERRK